MVSRPEIETVKPTDYLLARLAPVLVTADWIIHLTRVGRKVDNAIHRINLVVCFVNTYSVDSNSQWITLFSL